MTRVLFYILFITVALIIMGSVHYYLYRRLIRDPALPGPWRRGALVLLAALALSQPMVFGITKLFSPETARTLVFGPYVWMGSLLYLVLLLGLIDLIKLGARVKGGGVDAGRRVFLSRLGAGATVTATAGLSALAVRQAVLNVTVKNVDVTLRRLPRALDGITIVQLTDLHLGPTLGSRWAEGVVRKVNALGPDVVVITGDLADGRATNLDPALAPLSKIEAPLGRYFVTGNHEYYIDTDAILAKVRALGFTVLRNQRVRVGRGGHSFDLAGIDDHNARRHRPDHGPDLGKALAGRDPKRELVLLAHQPRAIDIAARHGVGLQLSGHTHAGQLWPWTYLVYLQQPYVAGLVNHKGTQLYISAGTGYWGPPMRLGTTSEITRVVLRARG